MTNEWGYKIVTYGTLLVMVKDPLLGWGELIVFNVAEYERFIDLASGSTLQISFKKIPLVKC